MPKLSRKLRLSAMSKSFRLTDSHWRNERRKGFCWDSGLSIIVRCFGGWKNWQPPLKDAPGNGIALCESLGPNRVNNSRFLILPWVRVRYLASTIRSLCARQLPADWERLYGYRPLLLETLVDAQ